MLNRVTHQTGKPLSLNVYRAGLYITTKIIGLGYECLLAKVQPLLIPPVSPGDGVNGRITSEQYLSNKEKGGNPRTIVSD
jgi:hypothetical protein